MDSLTITSLFLALVAATIAYSRWWPRRGGGRGELPPGPPRLLIFGNIFQLGPTPHKSLSQLAKTHGPLMSLQLGSQFAVVVSSPEMAREVMQKKGNIFANPFNPKAAAAHGHDKVSIGLLPAASDGWKKLHRIAKEHLFANQALEAGQTLRHEMLRKLVDHVSTSGGAVNVGAATFTTMSNLIFATLFSVEPSPYGASGSDHFKKLKEHVSGGIRYMGLVNISDFFPIFAPFDPQRIRQGLDYHMGCVLRIVDNIVQQRLQQRAASDYRKKNDFLETLLDLVEGDEYDLSIKEINHLLFDLVNAGTDSSAAATEWAMVELLLNPQKLAKVKAELKSVVGDDRRIIQESDISRLPYLQATIKETLRYHTIAPLLVPLTSSEETRVNGYIIPKKSRIIVNFWAISRDPSIWKDPESFEPERFLDNDIDFKGQHFELIPFGSGRRICSGIPLASRMVHCMVATLCHNFDWKLERGNESKQLQREEIFGAALQKKNPLWAIPIRV